MNEERALAVERRRERVIITWGIVLIALLLGALLLYALLPKASPHAALAECLAEAGAIMHGTDWCSHCQSQKRMFGKAFEEIAYVNCDYSRLCEERNITGLPTWTFADGSRLPGEQPLAVLAEKTGCPIEERS